MTEPAQSSGSADHFTKYLQRPLKGIGSSLSKENSPNLLLISHRHTEGEFVEFLFSPQNLSGALLPQILKQSVVVKKELSQKLGDAHLGGDPGQNEDTLD